jgi:hypothetical protein
MERLKFLAAISVIYLLFFRKKKRKLQSHASERRESIAKGMAR